MIEESENGQEETVTLDGVPIDGILDTADDIKIDKATKDVDESLSKLGISQLIDSALKQCKEAGKSFGIMGRTWEESKQKFPKWYNVLYKYVRGLGGNIEQKLPKYYKTTVSRITEGDIVKPYNKFVPNKLKNVMFAIDVSGSISEETLGKFYSQVKAFLKQTKYKVSGHFCFWNTIVTSTTAYKSWTDIDKIKDTKGGGGTDPLCVFDYIRTGKWTGKPDEQIDTEVMRTKYIVFYTDGYFDTDAVKKYFEKYKDFRPQVLIWDLWTKEDYENFKAPIGVKSYSE